MNWQNWWRMNRAEKKSQGSCKNNNLQKKKKKEKKPFFPYLADLQQLRLKCHRHPSGMVQWLSWSSSLSIPWAELLPCPTSWDTARARTLGYKVALGHEFIHSIPLGLCVGKPHWEWLWSDLELPKCPNWNFLSILIKSSMIAKLFPAWSQMDFQAGKFMRSKQLELNKHLQASGYPGRGQKKKKKKKPNSKY